MIYLARKIIGTVLDRENRNAINDNFEELYEYKNTADSAKEAADYAVSTAEYAKAKADSVQEQFNQVVIEGDSSVEAAQARLGADGTVYETLKERLDAEYAAVTHRLEEVSERFREVVINIKDMGAVGDGVSDDAPFIQKALDIAKESDVSITIKIPAGTFLVRSTLVVYKNTSITMDEGAVILRGHNGNIISNGEEGASYSGYDGNGNIVIEGGILDGNIDEFTNGFVMLNIGRGENITVRNVTFKDVINAHAVDMAACKNVVFDNCRFLGFRDTSGADVYYYSEAIQVSEITKTGFPAFGEYDGTPSINITVKNCYFGKSNTPNTKPWGVGVGHHSATHNIYNQNIKIIHNTFEECSYIGVRIFKYKDVIVEGNTFINCDRGVQVNPANADSNSSLNPDGTQSGLAQSAENIIVSNNHFINTRKYPISINGTYGNNNIAKVESVIVSNNIIDGQIETYPPIYLGWVNNVKIAFNILKDVHRGVQGNFISNVDVIANKFENLDKEFFYSDENVEDYRNSGYSFNINICDNTVENCQESGASIRYINNFTVRNNRLVNVGVSSNDTYNGIYAWNSKNGLIECNSGISDAENRLRYGANVSETCVNVRVFNNDIEAATGRELAGGETNFTGFYISYGTYPGKTYKVTMNNSGQFVITNV